MRLGHLERSAEVEHTLMCLICVSSCNITLKDFGWLDGFIFPFEGTTADLTTS
jgi:hypothetical protein